jgi:geranylgeranyl diphosphate synthase type II
LKTDRSELIYRRELKKIESKLTRYLKGKHPVSLYEPSKYVLDGGGKRIRPFLVLASAKAVNGSFSSVYNAALSVELLHNFTLVHDDIMDNSDKRRGRPTLHIKYDNNTAILAGDILVTLAYESLLKDTKKNAQKVLQTFTHGIIEVCEGQSLDKEFELRSNVTLKEYKVMIYKKTAALAEMCCSVGGQIAGANKNQLKALVNYGKYLGMAFQIQDDLLDIIGEEDKFGKKIGSDLAEGKKAFLFIRALEKAGDADLEMLQKIIKNKGINYSEVESYKDLYKRLKVIEDAKKEIVRYTNLALNNLSSLPNKEGSSLLIWLAHALIGRKR